MMETLLDPISADAPCGPDLEYDADFLDLQRRAAGKPEEQYGDTVIAGQAPVWRDVERIALGLFARTKDLRVVVLLTYAWIDSCGLEGYADGLRLAADLLDAYWEPLHPALVVEGAPDPLPRFNALAELAGPQGCARAARDAFGAGSPPPHVALAALEYLGRLRGIMSERVGSEWTLDASSIERQLAALPLDVPQARTPETAQEATQEPPEDTQSTPQPRASGPSAANGAAWRAAEISSRADIDFGLEKMCRYLELHEPSHPAPIFLRRAQRLLSLNFYEIFRDIAPESVRELDHLSGHRNESQQ